MKDFRFVYNFLKDYLKPFWGVLILMLFIGMLGIGTRLLAPYLMGVVISNLTYDASVNILINITIILAVIFIINTVMGLIANMLNYRTQARLAFSINQSIIKAIHNAPIFRIKDELSAGLAQKINVDSAMPSMWFANFMVLVVGNGLIVIFPFVYIFILDISFGIIAIFSIPIFILFYKLLKKKTFESVKNHENARTEYFGVLSLQFFNYKFIKINHIGNKLIEKLRIVLHKLMKAMVYRGRIYCIFQSSGLFVELLLQGLLIIYGGILVIEGRMAIGDLVVLNIYFPMVISSLLVFFDIGNDIQQNKMHITRLLELRDIEAQINGNTKLDEIKSINCSNIDFSYGDKKVIHNFSQSFEAGKTYVVVGENGSGKSTIINLILGLYTGEFSGSLKYNGIDIKDLDMKYNREKLIGVSEQEPTLVPDTIKFNITFKEGDDIDLGIINKFIDELGLREYVNAQKNGLDSIIDENSSNLSGGQKQKISIIKTLYKNPKLLVLDEPTSALDTESKTKLINYLTANKSDKITIVITHDEDFLNIADEVISFR